MTFASVCERSCYFFNKAIITDCRPKRQAILYDNVLKNTTAFMGKTYKMRSRQCFTGLSCPRRRRKGGSHPPKPAAGGQALTQGYLGRILADSVDSLTVQARQRRIVRQSRKAPPDDAAGNKTRGRGEARERKRGRLLLGFPFYCRVTGYNPLCSRTSGRIPSR